MAYCKWSDNNGYCDVYVSGDLKRGWTTRVAAKRYPKGRPLDGLGMIQKMLTERDLGDMSEAADAAQARCEVWEKEYPKIPIAHKDAGAKFKHTNPRGCAVNLERLKLEGFAIPQRVIIKLRDEAACYEQWGNDLPNSSQQGGRYDAR
ncbi:hypothetical protein [uncultured Ruegeria sp.]|uniref:hypothetical protein n=1 Tax=uncultured Ruegeria sp. TaxID=259304 RepID=UPI002610B85F|nr:hypothetical protein [uncultured Ruegeria sp.]